jgi:hypothetical protein
MIKFTRMSLAGCIARMKRVIHKKLQLENVNSRDIWETEAVAGG